VKEKSAGAVTTKRSNPWLSLLKAAIAVTAAYLVFRKVPFASVGPVLAECRLELLALVIVMQLSTTVAQAYRWKLFLRGSGLPLHKFLYFVFMGLFVNTFLPTSLAADAMKVVAFGRKYGGTQENIGIALLSKLQGMMVQLAFGSIGFFIFARELKAKGAFDHARLDGRAVAVGAVALCAGAAVLWALRGKFSPRRLLGIIWDLARDRSLLARTFAVSFIIQSLSSLSLYFLIFSLYPPARFWEILFLGTVVQTLLILPFGFGGVGVREYLNLLLFTDIGGIPADTILAASFLGYIPWLLMALIGGAWMALRNWRSVGSGRV